MATTTLAAQTNYALILIEQILMRHPAHRPPTYVTNSQSHFPPSFFTLKQSTYIHNEFIYTTQSHLPPSFFPLKQSMHSRLLSFPKSPRSTKQTNVGPVRLNTASPTRSPIASFAHPCFFDWFSRICRGQKSDQSDLQGSGPYIKYNEIRISDNYKPSDIVKHGRFSTGIYSQVHIWIFNHRNWALSSPCFPCWTKEIFFSVMFAWKVF